MLLRVVHDCSFHSPLDISLLLILVLDVSRTTTGGVPLARAMAALGISKAELDQALLVLDIKLHKEACLTPEEYARLAEAVIARSPALPAR